MKDIIKKVPVPLCGVMLGTAALGNLLQSYGEWIRSVCGILAAFLLILVLLKIVMFPGMVKEDMGNPIMASVAATFSMSLMILSTYMKPLIGNGAFVVWIAGIALHVMLIAYFTVKFLLNVQMPKVFASYFIVYAGIAAASITAPVYGQQGIGSVAFWFGFVTFPLLLVLVTYRYLKFPDIPDPAKPLICIYPASISLCTAGYVQSVTPKSFGMLAGMFAVASVLYVFALFKAAGYLKLPFFPSYAAFTFPFVISAIAAKQTIACAANLGHPLPFLQYVVLVETVIAVAMVTYIYIRFMGFLFGGKK